jgi:hypothetical protein
MKMKNKLVLQNKLSQNFSKYAKMELRNFFYNAKINFKEIQKFSLMKILSIC